MVNPSRTCRLSLGQKALVALLLSVFGLLSAPSEARAENLIKNPGQHNQYKFELEPQLAFRTHTPWGYANYYGNAYNGAWGGVGPGVRVNIPFMHNGPVEEINNNIGISFGGAMTFHGQYNPGTITVLNLPVAFQWNFYFTKIISVLGEAGLNTPITFGQGRSSFGVEPLFAGGGRFQWDKVGIIVRIGYPMLSVGANFQF